MRVGARLLVFGIGVLALSCAREPGPETAATDSAALTPESAQPGTTDGATATPATAVGVRAAPATENVVTVTEQVPGLLAEARFHSLDAQHQAQTKFPTGKVLDGKIERRAGDLVYTFRIRDEGGTVHAVMVDAIDGKLITSIPGKDGGTP